MKFKIENLKSYTVIPNTFLQDKTISLKAKGLLATFYSLPNDWDYSINGLCKITNTGIRQIRTTINELEVMGYVSRYEERNDKGQFEYIYIIRIEPKKEPFKNIKNSISEKRRKVSQKQLKLI